MIHRLYTCMKSILNMVCVHILREEHLTRYSKWLAGILFNTWSFLGISLRWNMSKLFLLILISLIYLWNDSYSSFYELCFDNKVFFWFSLLRHELIESIATESWLEEFSSRIIDLSFISDSLLLFRKFCGLVFCFFCVEFRSRTHIFYNTNIFELYWLYRIYEHQILIRLFSWNTWQLQISLSMSLFWNGFCGYTSTHFICAVVVSLGFRRLIRPIEIVIWQSFIIRRLTFWLLISFSTTIFSCLGFSC